MSALEVGLQCHYGAPVEAEFMRFSLNLFSSLKSRVDVGVEKLKRFFTSLAKRVKQQDYGHDFITKNLLEVVLSWPPDLSDREHFPKSLDPSMYIKVLRFASLTHSKTHLLTPQKMHMMSQVIL